MVSEGAGGATVLSLLWWEGWEGDVPTCWHCLLAVAWTAVVPSAFGLYVFEIDCGSMPVMPV